MKIILGAANTKYDGWLSTNRDTIDATKESSFHKFEGTISHFLAEHVWEHLTEEDARKATQNCFKFLKPGGRLRIAVPDGYKPDPDYIEWVRVGGGGTTGNDHRMLFNYQTLSSLLVSAGFKIELLEFWDEKGNFFFQEWSSEDGHVMRSSRYDRRNKEKLLSYTSLIIDGIKL